MKPHSDPIPHDIAAEELARAARLRRMANDLTAEARSIEARYRRPAKKAKPISMKELRKRLES